MHRTSQLVNYRLQLIIITKAILSRHNTEKNGLQRSDSNDLSERLYLQHLVGQNCEEDLARVGTKICNKPSIPILSVLELSTDIAPWCDISLK